jgi:hypothetical protein
MTGAGGGGGGGGAPFHHQAAEPVMVTLSLEGVTVSPVMAPSSRQRPALFAVAGVTHTHAAHASVSLHRAQQSCQVSTVKGAPAIVEPVKDPLK